VKDIHVHPDCQEAQRKLVAQLEWLEKFAEYENQSSIRRLINPFHWQRLCWKVKGLFKRDSGQAIAEFAVMLPVFVFVAFALIDIQWMTRDAAAIEYIVNETARCEAIQSGACAAPSSPQGYATTLAQNLRLSTDANFDLDTPPCTPSACSVSIRYHYKPLGAWFPALTISRTGSAAVPPQVTP
jgi:hypothetical protein